MASHTKLVPPAKSMQLGSAQSWSGRKLEFTCQLVEFQTKSDREEDWSSELASLKRVILGEAKKIAIHS